MSSIPIPSHEIALDVRLTLILLGLSPAMLASWLQASFPDAARRLPIDWHSLVLLAVAGASYVAIGTPPRLFSPALPIWMTVLLGLLLGGCAVVVEYAVLRVSRRWLQQRRGGQSPPRQLRGQDPAPFTDVAIGTGVVWRLRQHESPWPSGLSNLLLAAILEECIYRQSLLWLLIPVLGAFPGALVTILAYGLIHLYFGLASVTSKWIIGAIFTAAVLAGAGLLAAIVAHCVLNTAAHALRHRTSRKPQTASQSR